MSELEASGQRMWRVDVLGGDHVAGASAATVHRTGNRCGMRVDGLLGFAAAPGRDDPTLSKNPRAPRIVKRQDVPSDSVQHGDLAKAV